MGVKYIVERIEEEEPKSVGCGTMILYGIVAIIVLIIMALFANKKTESASKASNSATIESALEKAEQSKPTETVFPANNAAAKKPLSNTPATSTVKERRAIEQKDNVETGRLEKAKAETAVQPNTGTETNTKDITSDVQQDDWTASDSDSATSSMTEKERQRAERKAERKAKREEKREAKRQAKEQ